MFHLLKTLEGPYIFCCFALLVTCAAELERGETTLILEVSKGENLVKLNFFMEALDVS